MCIKPKEVRHLKYLRFISAHSSRYLEKLFSKESQILLSRDDNEMAKFREEVRSKHKKKLTKISLVGANDSIGLLECILDCPMVISTAK